MAELIIQLNLVILDLKVPAQLPPWNPATVAKPELDTTIMLPSYVLEIRDSITRAAIEYKIMRKANPLAATAEATIQRRADIDAIETPLVELMKDLSAPPSGTTAASMATHLDQLRDAYLKLSPASDPWSTGLRDAIHVIVPYRDAQAPLNPSIIRATDENKALGTIKGADVDAIRVNQETEVANRLIDVNTKFAVVYNRWADTRARLHRWLSVKAIDDALVAAQVPLAALNAASAVPRTSKTHTDSVMAILACAPDWTTFTASLAVIVDDFKVGGAAQISIDPAFKLSVESFLPLANIENLLPVRPALSALNPVIGSLSVSDPAITDAITAAVGIIAAPALIATTVATADQYRQFRNQWILDRITARVVDDARVATIDAKVTTVEAALKLLIDNCMAPQTATTEAASVTLAAALIVALTAVQVDVGTAMDPTITAAMTIPAIHPLLPALTALSAAEMATLAQHPIPVQDAIVKLNDSFGLMTEHWATVRSRLPAADTNPTRVDPLLAAVRDATNAMINVFVTPGRPASAADQVPGLKLTLIATFGTFSTGVAPLLISGNGNPHLARLETAINEINTGNRQFQPAPLSLLALAPVIAGFAEAQLSHQEVVLRVPVVAFVDKIKAMHLGYDAPRTRRFIGANRSLVAVDQLYQRMQSSAQTLLLCYVSQLALASHAESVKALAAFDVDLIAFQTAYMAARGIVNPPPAFVRLRAACRAIPPLIDVAMAFNPPYIPTESQRLIRPTTSASDVVQFGEVPGGNALGPVIIEAASEQELDRKLATMGVSSGMLYALVHDKPGDQVALRKAVAINLNANAPPDLQRQSADGKRGATGWLYHLIPLANGTYLKEFRDYIRPSLYNV